MHVKVIIGVMDSGGNIVSSQSTTTNQPGSLTIDFNLNDKEVLFETITRTGSSTSDKPGLDRTISLTPPR